MKPARARAAKLLEDIINQIASEESISNKKVDIVLQAVFGVIANDIRTGNMKGTHIKYLGKFKMKPYNINKFLSQGKEKLEVNGSNA